MRLHENEVLFGAGVQAAANYFGLSDTMIEKDYWLTSVLKNLSQSSHCNLFVFKGGTSLSKAFGMIQRFSEDVDLALLGDGLTGNQIKSRIDKVSKELTHHLPEIKIEGMTKKWSRFRRTAHRYPMLTSEIFNTQLRFYLILELNAFGNPCPHHHTKIKSMIAEFLLSQNQGSLVEEYGLESFTVQVLQPERTLSEKILALVRASYNQDPIAQLQNKIRHAYDLHMMMATPKLQEFVNSNLLFETLSQSQVDDAASREFQGDWNKLPLSEALIFSDTSTLWNELAKTYTTSFSSLVYGKLPSIEEVRESLRGLKTRLKHFDTQAQVS